jgi:hypothetical protein
LSVVGWLRFARRLAALVVQGHAIVAHEYPLSFRTMMNEETAPADNRGLEVDTDERCDFDNETPARPEIRAAFEPTCCGSGCADCPF